MQPCAKAVLLSDPGCGKLTAVKGPFFMLSERARLILALAGGLLLALAFPKPGVAGLAWVAPGLILLAADGAASPFRAGYAAGLAFHLAGLSWLLLIPVKFFPILGWLLLCGFLALYPAAWCWICVRTMHGARGRDGGKTWLGGLAWSLFCAAAWVALEMAQARVLSGLPWNLLGVSQHRMLPLIQIASVTGVYGVSFLAVWFSASLVVLLWSLPGEPARRGLWQRHLLAPVVAVALVYAWGATRLLHQPLPERHLQVALVQPSIPQTMIWDPSESSNRFQQVLRLSEQALRTRPDLLVWPEAATPKLLRFDQDIREPVTSLVRTHQVWLVLGADDAEPRGTNAVAFFNSSFLLDRQGRIAASYRKRHLVIFGEYIPLARWLPFLKWFTPIDGGFEAGDRVVPFDLTDLRVRTATLICFEDVFPHLVREYATPETDFLLNLTNDGWFGEGAAQWQQAASAVFRAVENGLPLVRCANNGLTCWIDAVGAMHEVYFGDSKDIYGPGVKTARIPLRPEGQPRPLTFYTRHGDLFGWACVAIAAAGLAGVMWRQKQSRSQTSLS